jgi:hypothetical protein
METLSDEIMNAVHRLNISASRFRSLPAQEAERVVSRAERVFVRVPGRRWWWTAFRCRGYAATFVDHRGYRRLTQIAPPSDRRNWLIANVDEESSGPVLVYEGSLEAMQAVLSACYAFEYYVVSPNYDWLICESHHNVVIAIGYKAMKRLKIFVSAHPSEIAHTSAWSIKQ